MRSSFVIVVHTLVFNAAGESLLLRRANTGFMDGRYALPGGHRQAGEGVGAAAGEANTMSSHLRGSPMPGLPDQRLASKMKSTPPS